MKCDDPDFGAFESNLCTIIWAGKLDKTAALVSNLCPDASDPQLVGVLSKEDAEQDSHCYSATHHLLASLIWKIHRMIIKHLQNKSLEGSLFWCCLLAHRKTLWICRPGFFTILRLSPNPTGNYWNCWLKVMYRGIQLAGSRAPRPAERLSAALSHLLASPEQRDPK